MKVSDSMTEVIEFSKRKNQLKTRNKLGQFEADRAGQLRPDEVGQSKPESIDQCDRILHNASKVKRLEDRKDIEEAFDRFEIL